MDDSSYGNKGPKMHKQLTAEMLMTDAERQKKLATKMFTMTDDKVRM